MAIPGWRPRGVESGRARGRNLAVAAGSVMVNSGHVVNPTRAARLGIKNPGRPACLR